MGQGSHENLKNFKLGIHFKKTFWSLKVIHFLIETTDSSKETPKFHNWILFLKKEFLKEFVKNITCVLRILFSNLFNDNFKINFDFKILRYFKNVQNHRHSYSYL